MSKNAANKRRAKAIRRDKWSRLPIGTPLEFVISNIDPQQTPFLSAARARMDVKSSR